MEVGVDDDDDDPDRTKTIMMSEERAGPGADWSRVSLSLQLPADRELIKDNESFCQQRSTRLNDVFFALHHLWYSEHSLTYKLKLYNVHLRYGAQSLMQKKENVSN